ncbi:multifunctional beta-oxidation protein-like protein, partial [Aureobasidium melanogenum]
MQSLPVSLTFDNTSKSDLDVLELAECLQHSLASDTEEAEAMKDGSLEATDLGELRVNVQWVAVTRQTVDGSLLFAGLLLDHGVWLALRSLLLACILVLGGGTGRHDTGVTLVNNLNQLGVCYQSSLGRDGEGLDLEELLSVEKHVRREVRHNLIEGEGRRRVERRNDTKGWDDLEVVITLINKRTLSSIIAVSGVISTTVTEVGNSLPLSTDMFRSQLDINREAVSSRSLPASLCSPTGTDLVKSTSARLRHHVRAQKHDKRCNIVRLEGLDHLLGHDGTGHVCTSIWCNGVDQDVILLTFSSKSSGETKDTALGGGVVGLAEVTVDTTGAGSVDDSAVLLLQEVRPCSLGNLVGSSQVNIQNLIKLLVVHVGKGLVAEDTCVVDNDVNATISINGGLDDCIAIFC